MQMKQSNTKRKGVNQYTCDLNKIKLANTLRESGMHYAVIAAQLGVGVATVYRWCNSQNSDMYNAQARRRVLYRCWNLYQESRPNPLDVAARLAEIPIDNRSPGEILCGEPLLGRRAIDRAGLNHNGKAHITLPTVQVRSIM